MIVDFNPFYMLIIIPAVLIVSGVLAIMHKKRQSSFIIQVILLLMNIVFSVLFFVSGGSIYVFNIFTLYSFSVLFIGVFSLIMLLIVLLSYRHSIRFEYVSLLLSIVYFGAITVSSATSLVMIVIGIEMIGLGSVFMTLFEKKDSVEAGIKLFIMSASALAIMIVGISLLLLYDGSLSITAITTSAPVDYIILLGMLLLGAAFGVEAGLFPFSLWVPDVYQQVQGNVTAMLAGLNKKVGFVAILIVFGILFVRYWTIFSELFTILAILTMFFGNIMALIQKDVKRMFAYSTISQSGYILIGIASASQLGFEASIFQIIAHSLMIVGTFAIVMLLEFRGIKTIDDYTGLYARNGFIAFGLSAFMLSMVGLPGLMGFYGKFLLFTSAINSHMLLLVVLGLINSVISMYYYGRLINAIYSDSLKNKIFIDNYSYIVVLITLSLIIVFGIYPTPLIIASQIASGSLLLI